MMGSVRPRRLMRKVGPDLWEGSSLQSTYRTPVLRVELVRRGEVIPITTSTGTLFTEGYASHNCGDITTPVKMLVPQFRQLEHNVLRAVGQRFDVPYEWLDHVHVHEADLLILALEKRSLIGNNVPWNIDLPEPPAGVEVRCLERHDARRLFLERFAELDARALGVAGVSRLVEGPAAGFGLSGAKPTR